jgi:hypothetical protein
MPCRAEPNARIRKEKAIDAAAERVKLKKTPPSNKRLLGDKIFFRINFHFRRVSYSTKKTPKAAVFQCFPSRVSRFDGVFSSYEYLRQLVHWAAFLVKRRMDVTVHGDAVSAWPRIALKLWNQPFSVFAPDG